MSPDGGAGAAATDGGAPASEAGASAGNMCDDTSSDPLNCGACGHACAAAASCIAGTCVDCTQLACPRSGELLFVAPRNVTPQPAIATLPFTTTLEKLDLVLDLDTTADMTPALNDLTSSFLSSVVPEIETAVPSLAVGVFDFKDFGELYVVRAGGRLQTMTGSGGLALSNTFVNLLPSGGGDAPEAGWESLFSIASTTPVSVDGYVTPLALPETAHDETSGTLLGAGFRSGAARVVVTVSTAEWHDAEGVPVDGQGNGLNDYTSHLGAPIRAQTIAALTSAGIQTVGMVPVAPVTGNLQLQATLLAQATGAVVAPSAFGSLNARPPLCAVGQCCTGFGGKGQPPAADGTCPLVPLFGSDGTGTAPELNLGVNALVAGASYDSYLVAMDIDAGTVATFFGGVQANLTGAGAASACLALPPDRVVSVAGQLGGVSHVAAGQQLCFDVTPQTNTSMPPASTARFFRAQLQLKGAVGANTSIDLDTPKTVVFMVPPG